MHVQYAHATPANPGQQPLAQARASYKLPATPPLALHEEHHLAPTAGILRAAEDTEADLLVFIARPRRFLGRLFHRSITAQVLRQTPVPVLLLPARAAG